MIDLKLKSSDLIPALLTFLFFALFLSEFSLWTFKQLNSDHALHILMAERFDGSKDWYYWGQNRLGSLLPLLGSGLIALGLPSLSALALVQLGLLIATGFMVSRLLARPYIALAALALLLFPIYPFWMSNGLGHPYLAQYFFAFLLLLVLKSLDSLNGKAILLPLLAVLMLWSSEMSLAFLLAVLIVEYRHLGRLVLKRWYLLLPFTVLGFWFLIWAKRQATAVESYSQWIAAPEAILSSMIKQFQLLFELLIFSGNKTYNSVLAWFIILASLWSLIRYLRLKQLPSNLCLILMLSSLGSWALVHISHWNFAMGQPLRYYAAAYFFWGMALVFSLADHLNTTTWLNRSLAAAFAILQIGAAFGFNRSFDTGAENRLERAEAEYLIQEALLEEGLDSVAVLGSYWNSYLMDGLSEQVIAFPCKGSQVRDYRYFEEFKAQQDFMVFRNGCLFDLSDTLYERELELIKVSEDRNLAEFQYAYYRKVQP